MQGGWIVAQLWVAAGMAPTCRDAACWWQRRLGGGAVHRGGGGAAVAVGYIAAGRMIGQLRSRGMGKKHLQPDSGRPPSMYHPGVVHRPPSRISFKAPE